MDKELVDLIYEFKKKHKNVYMTVYKDQIYIWRLPTLQEYSKFLNISQGNKQKLQEIVLKECVLYPPIKDTDYMDAGMTEYLSSLILNESSFDNLNQIKALYNTYASELNYAYHVAELLIKLAFPTLTFEDIRNFDMHTFIWYLTRAEFVLKNINGFDIDVKRDLFGEGSKQDNKEQEQQQQKDKLQQILDMYKHGDPMLQCKVVPEKYTEYPFVIRPQTVMNTFIKGLRWND